MTFKNFWYHDTALLTLPRKVCWPMAPHHPRAIPDFFLCYLALVISRTGADGPFLNSLPLIPVTKHQCVFESEALCQICFMELAERVFGFLKFSACHGLFIRLLLHLQVHEPCHWQMCPLTPVHVVLPLSRERATCPPDCHPLSFMVTVIQVIEREFTFSWSSLSLGL